MRWFRRLWIAAAVPLSGLGILGACLALTIPTMITAVLLAGAVGAAANQIMPDDFCIRFALPRRCAAAMATAALSGLALAGWTGFLGVGAGLLAVAFTLSWPAAAAYYGMRRRRPTESAVQEPNGDQDATVLPAATKQFTPTALTLEELCWAWRASYTALQRSEPTVQARIVSERARYLDELERRAPAGFARWLATGARAGSDPTRFVTAEQTPQRHDPR